MYDTLFLFISIYLFLKNLNFSWALYTRLQTVLYLYELCMKYYLRSGFFYTMYICFPILENPSGETGPRNAKMKNTRVFCRRCSSFLSQAASTPPPSLSFLGHNSSNKLAVTTDRFLFVYFCGYTGLKYSSGTVLPPE